MPRCRGRRRARATILAALATLAICASGGVSARQSRATAERPSGPIVDFIAVQADGTPVTDLQSSEVEIRINGRVRTAAYAAARDGRAAARPARRATSPARAVRHQRPMRGRPPLGIHRRRRVVRRRPRTAPPKRGRRTAVRLHAGGSGGSDRAALHRCEGALHLRHGTRPAGDGRCRGTGDARQRPGRTWPAGRAGSSKRSTGSSMARPDARHR